MAESSEQSDLVADPECSFSSHCGRNVIVDGQTARWNSVVSGGRVFIDKPIAPEAELKMSFDGKGHAEVGILTKDPASISDISKVENMRELTVIQSARIYKQTGTANIKRSSCGRKIITEADKTSSIKVGRTDKVWVTVNIIFGDLEVEIETEGYNFSKESGGNIKLEHYDTWANLKSPNPCAVCFVGTPIRRMEALNFQIDPILRDGKPSRNFSIKIAISQSNPIDIMSGNDIYYDITSLPVIHFDEFPKKCKNEIQIGLSDNGTVQINYEKGTLNKETNNEHIYCIFELCRIKLHCKSKTKLNNRVDFPPSAENVQRKSETKQDNRDDDTQLWNRSAENDQYKSKTNQRKNEDVLMLQNRSTEDLNVIDAIVVPPNSEYVRSKKMLESIRHDAENISIHTDDFNSDMESRNIDFSLVTVNNDSNINNTVESGIRNNETLPSGENIALLHNKIEDLNSRLLSIEETIVNRETGKEAMQQSQFQELKLEIQSLKKILRETQSSGQYPTNSKISTEKSLEKVIQKNYVILIKMIDPVPLLDLLYESDCISHNDCDRVGKLFQIDRENANRDLLGIIIRKQSFDLDHFESVLFQSKQIGVLAVLFPDKYGKKK
ncbi:uncharacterized protein LOC127721575 [Mytilus californianus]|uniref:uncharacterized protein LOC127721575 n=1 Tax=Mytilus californianus TaxID=6549 RepID=UPI002247283E|nr:uncharacterized protein LOC127721575 [Mytilus californianus]